MPPTKKRKYLTETCTRVTRSKSATIDPNTKTFTLTASSSAPQVQDFFLKLPDEVITIIFSFLSTDELTAGVSMVCQRFQELGLHPRLWTQVEIPPEMVMDSRTAVHLLDRCTLLKRLRINWDRKDSEFLATYALKYCESIYFLEVHFDYEDSLDDFFKTIRDHGKSLRRLEMSRGKWGYRWETDLYFKSLESITHLKLLDSDVNNLKGIADNCERLQHLTFENTAVQSSSLNDEELNYFLETTKSRLVGLVIKGNNQFTGASYKNFAICNLLQRLEISNASQLKLQELKAILSITALKTLLIHGTDSLFPLDFSLAFDQKKTNLTSLSIFMANPANIVGKDLEAIAKSCPNLLHLNLRKCRCYSEDGLKQFDAGLRALADHCRRLESFEDRHNRKLCFSDSAVNYFILKVKNTIKKLHFCDRSELGDSALVNLAKCKLVESFSCNAKKLTLSSLQAISKLPKLATLDLQQSDHLTGQDLVRELGSGALSQLKSLDLSDWKELDDEGLLQIAKSCSALVHFRLRFSSLKITNDGLPNMIRRCAKLRNLEVGTNRGRLFQIRDEIKRANPVLEVLVYGI